MRIPGEPPLQVRGLERPAHRIGEPLPLQQLGHQLQICDPTRPPLLHTPHVYRPDQAN